jgi:hypothetical protein
MKILLQIDVGSLWWILALKRQDSLRYINTHILLSDFLLDQRKQKISNYFELRSKSF